MVIWPFLSPGVSLASPGILDGLHEDVQLRQNKFRPPALRARFPAECDEGVGISLDEQAHIFERFYRVDGALSRKTQGTGLGLYLTQAIIEAHQGTIRVESKPGEGSTFYFTLPR